MSCVHELCTWGWSIYTMSDWLLSQNYPRTFEGWGYKFQIKSNIVNPLLTIYDCTLLPHGRSVRHLFVTY